MNPDRDEQSRKIQRAAEYRAARKAGWEPEPVPKVTRSLDPDWWVKGLIEREQLTGLAPPVVTKLRDIDQELTRWRERRAARYPATSQPDQKSLQRRRPWWRRRRS